MEMQAHLQIYLVTSGLLVISILHEHQCMQLYKISLFFSSDRNELLFPHAYNFSIGLMNAFVC